MMVSTKGRYALRVMLDLAMQKQEEYVSLNDIANIWNRLSVCSTRRDFCRAEEGKTEATGWHADRRNTRSARF